jgi:hypothetical protein
MAGFSPGVGAFERTIMQPIEHAAGTAEAGVLP